MVMCQFGELVKYYIVLNSLFSFLVVLFRQLYAEMIKERINTYDAVTIEPITSAIKEFSDAAHKAAEEAEVRLPIDLCPKIEPQRNDCNKSNLNLARYSY